MQNPAARIRNQSLLIIIILLSSYYPSLFAPFNSVDDVKMVNQLINVDTISLKGLFFPGAGGQYYRPLLFLTFLFDKFVWGVQESFMHLENVLFHLVNTLLVFCLARQFIKAWRWDTQYFPFVVALLFGLHPIATEPVNWVSGRTDLLAGVFVLSAVLLFTRSIHISSFWQGGAGAFLLLCGCLSKETALFVLPVLLLWCLVPPRDYACMASGRLRAFLFASYLASGFAYLVMRWYALNGGDKIVSTMASGASSSGAAFGIWDMIRVGLKTSGFYCKKLVVPFPLNFGIIEISPHYIWLGLLVCVGGCYCLYARTTVSYLFIAAFCLVSPAFIVPLLKITWTPVAERYAYIASAPFLVALSFLFIRCLRSRLPPLAITFFVAILLFCSGFATIKRNVVWQDNVSLFEDTVKKSPNFPAAKNELAIALVGRGKTDEANKILLANSGDDTQPSSINKIKVAVNNGRYEEAYRMMGERKARGGKEDKDSLDLMYLINEQRFIASKSESQSRKIRMEMLTILGNLHSLSGDPVYFYRIGLVQLRLGNRLAAKQSFESAWRNSAPDCYYHNAAKKLAESL
ncbi:hypothetical protein F6V30_12390 [Oryzomonas sagensis]|uniref:Glycosyltransferase RgtA/B/C/D-like domain-containing protein n=1 Tax=Oryzomonas sagensis TaxID=2603857 RepID=A0ABQ6TM95_9BACT|nr:hypothetical protein [Oryzomonas sagensis]KAB0669595.1 hypothetical protein F6V30_12390 [Oryzomonas sagensis]